MPSESKIFTDDALRAQVEKLDQLPKEEIRAGVSVENGDVGVIVDANKQWQNGVFVEGEVSWWKRQGYKALAAIGWKGKP